MSIEYKFGYYINLFDLDDTLVNSQHRCDFSDGGNFNVDYWNKNNTVANALKDHVIYQMFSVFKSFSLHKDTYNVCITSREISDIDLIFFKYHGIEFNDYLHRDSLILNDRYNERLTMNAVDMKDCLLKNYNPVFPWKPGFAFDDKLEVVDVFKKHGFKAYNAWDVNCNQTEYKRIIIEGKKMFDEKIV